MHQCASHIRDQNPVTRWAARNAIANCRQLFRDDYHPHPDPRHVMQAYRRQVMAWKKSWGRSARSIKHYRPMVRTYIAAKRAVLEHACAL